MKKAILLILSFLIIHKINSQEKLINLNEAINTGVSNNHNLKGTFQEIAIAKGNYKSNFLLPDPVINARHEEIPFGEGLTGAEQKTYSLEQQLEFPLRYPAKIKSLKAGINSAELNYKRSELNLKSDIRNTYLSWLAFVSRVSIARESLKLSEEFEGASQKLFTAGEIGAIPISQARINLSNAKLQLNNALSEEAQGRARLQTLLGLGSEIILKPSDSLVQYVTVNSEASIFDTTKQISLQYSNSLLLGARANMKYQRSAWMPDIRLEIMKQTILGNSSYYGAGIGITVPLWFTNTRGNIQRATALYRQTTENYLQEKLRLMNQWQAIQQSLQQYRSTLEEYRKISEESQSLMSNAKKAYEAGELSYLEFLSAQQTYLTSKRNFLQSILDYQINMTDYYMLTGAF